MSRQPKPLTIPDGAIIEPLSKTAVAERMHDGRLTVVVQVGLEELIANDVEGLDDLLDERILKHGVLADINWRIVGAVPGKSGGASGSVWLEVSAQVEDY